MEGEESLFGEMKRPLRVLNDDYSLWRDFDQIVGKERRGKEERRGARFEWTRSFRVQIPAAPLVGGSFPLCLHESTRRTWVPVVWIGCFVFGLGPRTQSCSCGSALPPHLLTAAHDSCKTDTRRAQIQPDLYTCVHGYPYT